MLKATVKFFDNKPAIERGSAAFVRKAVRRSSRAMERFIKLQARDSFNQITGHLRRSITAHETTGFAEAEVRINPVREGADVNYALFLEYGTKHIAPRAFIRKGVDASKGKIQSIFKEEARKFASKARK